MEMSPESLKSSGHGWNRTQAPILVDQMVPGPHNPSVTAEHA